MQLNPDSTVRRDPDTLSPQGEKVYVVTVLVGNWPGATREVNERCADLGALYVRAIADMVAKFAPRDIPWEFICFTDRDSIEGVVCRPIPTGLCTYFNKLFLFANSNFPPNSRVLYLDLDTVLVGSWKALATLPLDKIVLLRDIWCPTNPASGLMSWRTTAVTARIWEDFEEQSRRRPPYTPPTPRPGLQTYILTDEDWLFHFTQPNDWAAFQDLCPGTLVSYKHHIRCAPRHGVEPPPLTPDEQKAVRVIYFHGLPRPHSTPVKWNPIAESFYPEHYAKWRISK